MTAPHAPLRTAIVGVGRVGGSFGSALESVGWPVAMVHHEEAASIAQVLASSERWSVPEGVAVPDEADLVLLCVPDASVSRVAAELPASDRSVVVHCCGILDLDVLGGHGRTASIHPLVSLPDPEVGASRLRGAWFAVAGDDEVRSIVAVLGGTALEVAPQQRVSYHAAAVVASNHLVALLAHTQRIAAHAGVPLEAYLDLVRGTVENVAVAGVEGALTGPVARGDWATVKAHLDALGPAETDEYLAGMVATASLAGREVPWAEILP